MSKYSVYGELPFDEAKAPEQTEYTCDVLVVGGDLTFRPAVLHKILDLINLGN